MTLLVENFAYPNGDAETGVAQLRVPTERAATLGPGRVTTAVTEVPIIAGLLSVNVEPGVLFVRIILRGNTYAERAVTIPASGTVRLSDLVTATAPTGTYPGATTYPAPTPYPAGV